MFAAVAKSPRLFHAIGHVLFSMGGALLVFGIAGQIALRVTANMRAKVKLTSPSNLAELYPALPTWFIPEGWLGCVMLFLCIASGIAMAMQAKLVLRQHGRYGR